MSDQIVVYVKSNLNIPTAPPVLDEQTFQQLLAAAYILQESSDRRIGESNSSLRAAAITRVEPNQDTSLPLVCGGDPSDLAVNLTSAARTDVEPILPHTDSVIPPEIAHQLSALASQLNTLLESEVRPDSELSQIPVLTASEKASLEQQIVTSPARIEAHLEESFSEPSRFSSLSQPLRLSRSRDSSHGIIARMQVSEQIIVPRGTVIVVRLAETLSSAANKPGDTFSPLCGRNITKYGHLCVVRGKRRGSFSAV